MRLPAALRYLPARLQPLQNPVAWMPALALIFVGIFAWEYNNNPERFQWGGVDQPTSALAGSTPEEQGITAIDTLDVLLTDTRVNSLGASNLAPDATATNQSVTQPEAQASPFADYLAQYQFPGVGSAARVNSSNSSNAAVQPRSVEHGLQVTQSSSTMPDSSLFLLSTQSVERQESALSQALSEQSGASTVAPQQTTPNQTRPQGAESDDSLPAVNLPIDQSEVVPGTLPGSAANLIRTTPAMSPPLGTTGYRPPASLNLSTYDRALNRSNQFTPGLPSATAPAPSFEVRQPQRPANVLPEQGTAGISQPQFQVPEFSGGAVTSDTGPTNYYDAFFEGY